MRAFFAGEIQRLAAHYDHHLALHIQAVEIAVFQQWGIDPVTGEDHARLHLRPGVRQAGAAIEFVDIAERAGFVLPDQFQRGRAVIQPGAAQRHRLQIAAVGSGRLQPHLAELAGDIGCRDIVALGPGLAAAQQVVGEEGDVGFQPALQQRVAVIVGESWEGVQAKHGEQDLRGSHLRFLQGVKGDRGYHPGGFRSPYQRSRIIQVLQPEWPVSPSGVLMISKPCCRYRWRAAVMLPSVSR